MPLLFNRNFQGLVELVPGGGRPFRAHSEFFNPQDSLEAKRTGAVLDQLAPEFRAQEELDREWAKRTMTVLFLQNANVKVVALNRTSRVTSKTSGETDAQVVLAGGQGLIPERASPYSVKLRWRREGRQWKLASLEWE